MKKEYLGKRKKAGLLLASMTLLVLTFTGCQAEEAEELPITGNAVVVTQEGKLISYLVDSFDKDYYDAQELAAMAMTEAEKFSEEMNFSTEPELVISGAEVWPDSKQVALIMEFANAKSYAAYYNVDAFYGTVAEAMGAGWALSGRLTDTKKEVVLSDEKLMDYGEKMIFICSHEVDIRVPGKILAEGEYTGLKYIMMK
ncbi:MAG: hypothetical protein IJZ82_09045 [Lachnospiraceae bacterium]|nr:hypothetical protein [Lachnospiraceae bacterium]